LLTQEDTFFHGLVRTTEPDHLRGVLGAACGIMGVVRKRRTVRMVGRTRVHLDEVEGLGRFIELEVVPRHRGVPRGRSGRGAR
jgi:hypothetical protein